MDRCFTRVTITQNTRGTPAPSFPLDPYHSWYRVLDFFVDVVESGRKRCKVLVHPLILMQYGADGIRRPEYIALTSEALDVEKSRLDALEKKVGGPKSGET